MPNIFEKAAERKIDRDSEEPKSSSEISDESVIGSDEHYAGLYPDTRLAVSEAIPPTSRFFDYMPTFAGFFSLICGSVVLLGWLLDIALLKSFIPGQLAMKTNAAVCFVVTGLIILLIISKGKHYKLPPQYAIPAARILSLGLLLIGFLTLIEYIGNIDLSIDQLLFTEWPIGLNTSHPNRIAPTTAFNFLLIGLAFLLIDKKTKFLLKPTEALIFIVANVSFFVVVGNLYGVTFYRDQESFTVMALNTAVIYLVISAGILSLRHGEGIMSIIVSRNAGGISSRKLLPPVIIVTLFFGWLRIFGQDMGWFDIRFGDSILTVFSIAIMVALILAIACSLNKSDAEREQHMKLIQSARDYSENIINSIRDPVLVLDKNLRIKSANISFYKIFGIEREEINERAFDEFANQKWANKKFNQLLIQSLLPEIKTIDNYELEINTSNQGNRMFSINARKIYGAGNNTRFVLLVFWDITDRKKYEEELKNINISLEDKSLKLDAANKELEAFSYSVSHDMRAPLRSIDGFSQVLVEDYSASLDDKAKNFLGRIRAGVQRMAQLIDDMLMLSRVSRSEIHRAKVDLAAWARAIVEELQKQDTNRRVKFIIPDSMIVEGDSHLLGIVMENLLGNSWKFTSKHPEATIELGMFITADNTRTYFVRDDGAGFEMKYSHNLFGAFQRLHTIAEFDGTGIGLATVQRIIHKHGGQVWAKGAVEKGATIYFTIP
jgi:PAS domain S-box-containing protein